MEVMKGTLKRSDNWKGIFTSTMRRMSFRGGGSGGRGPVSPESDSHQPHGGSPSTFGSPQGCEDVVLSGYLKKLKTGKRKFFVLHAGVSAGRPPTDATSSNSSGAAYHQLAQQARLEYFDTEKKWRAGADPKRSIALRSCFNINRKQDAKGRLLVALYTSADCLLLQCATVEEHEEWLSTMLQLQQGILPSDQRPSPHFDHIWEVCVKPKSLGTQQNLQGDHRVCLTSRSLSLIRLERHRTASNNADHRGLGGGRGGDRECQPTVEFTLNSIRRCGHTDCFFFMELGRSSVTGAGELWMQTDDTVIAQNMHEVILSAMKSSKVNEESLRPRSNSTSETKPLTIPTIPHGHSPHNVHQNGYFYPHPPSLGGGGIGLGALFGIPRERCDSMPARPRQSSESFFDQQPAVPTRCNTIDCTQVGGRPWSAGAGGGVSPLGHLHGHALLESCSEEPHSHGATTATHTHLHLNVSNSTNSHNPHSQPQSIVEETGGDGMSEYLPMTSPGQLDSTGSLLGSPVTLTDGGTSSLSSGHGGIHPLPGPHSGGGSQFLPRQPSSASSSSEYMRMSPSHDQLLPSGGSSSSSANLNNNGANGGNNNSSIVMSISNNNNNNNNNNNVQDVMMGKALPSTAVDTDAYMSMSPIGLCQAIASKNLLNNGTLANGYVPMEPPSSLSSTMVISGSIPPLGAPGLRSGTRGVSESSPMSPPGYMEMAPLSSSLPKSVGALSGSWGSSIHSIHDASPTFDLSVEGFQLDKVKSFIAAGDGDDQSLRTGRSFSCGKRPSEQRNSSRSGLAAGQGSGRVRAYSVGSQANHAATLAAAAKKRTQQNQQQDVLGTPTSDRGRSNSYSKKSSSTTTLGSRHSEEFMEINYDENWHRATASASAAMAAMVPSLQATSSLPPVSATNINSNGSSSNNNNKESSEYLPMIRVPNYKEPESSMKLFPLKEVEVSSSLKEASSFQEKHEFGPVRTRESITGNNSITRSGKTGHSDYMDLSEQSISPLSLKAIAASSSHTSQQQQQQHIHTHRATPSDTEGEYVSLDMSRPWQVRSFSLCGAPEPKKCKSELITTMSFDVNMTAATKSSPPPGQAGPPPPPVVAVPSLSGALTTTQHNYENLMFGANGATVEAVSSSQDSQEPMETDQPSAKLPPPTPAPSPTPENTASSIGAPIHTGLPTDLFGQPVSPPSPITVPSTRVPMQVMPGSDRELNYASLNLSQTNDEPPSPSNSHEPGGASVGADIVPPALGLANGMGLTGTSASGGVSYSEVYFRKSEGLRGSMLREGSRV